MALRREQKQRLVELLQLESDRWALKLVLLNFEVAYLRMLVRRDLTPSPRASRSSGTASATAKATRRASSGRRSRKG